MSFHHPQIDINRIIILLVLFLPVIVWTFSDYSGVTLSANTEKAISTWTLFAAGIVGMNYVFGPKIKQ